MTNNDVEAAKEAYLKAHATTDDNERVMFFLDFDRIRSRLSPKEISALEKAIKADMK